MEDTVTVTNKFYRYATEEQGIRGVVSVLAISPKYNNFLCERKAYEILKS